MAQSYRTRRPRGRTIPREPDADTPTAEAVDKIVKTQIYARNSNISDETIREYCKKARKRKGQLDKARQAMQEAGAYYRAALKDAKKAGLTPADIKWWLAASERDPGEIDAETNRRNRIARLMGLPIGTQLGLFDEDGKPVTVATRVDQDYLGTADDDVNVLLRDPYREGYDLGWAGKAYSQGEWEGPDQERHLTGWQDAQSALVGKLGAVQ